MLRIQKLGLEKIPTSNPHFSAKNKLDISGGTGKYTKHIYMGSQRITSKCLNQNFQN